MHIAIFELTYFFFLFIGSWEMTSQALEGVLKYPENKIILYLLEFSYGIYMLSNG
jgi:hypothetical protein